MRIAVPGAWLFALVLAAGCGSSNNDTSAIQSFCKSGAAAICARVFQCDPQGAAQLYGSQAQCTSDSTSRCSSAQCPSGKSFNQASADACVAAYPSADCSSLAQGQYPTACTTVCQ